MYDLAIPERYSNGSLLPPHLREAALAALAALPAEQELAMRDPLSDPATLDLEGCNRQVPYSTAPGGPLEVLQTGVSLEVL